MTYPCPNCGFVPNAYPWAKIGLRVKTTMENGTGEWVEGEKGTIIDIFGDEIFVVLDSNGREAPKIEEGDRWNNYLGKHDPNHEGNLKYHFFNRVSTLAWIKPI